jgi:site-specific recombinase XerD
MTQSENRPTIEETAEQFLEYLRATQSPRSARAYGTGLRHFLRFLRGLDNPPECITDLHPPTVVEFISWIYNYLLEEVAGGDPEKVRNTTKQSYLYGVARFLEWLVVETQRLAWSAEEYDVLRKAMRRAARVKAGTSLSPNKLPTPKIVAALREEVHRTLDLPDDAPRGEVRRQELARLRNIAVVEALISSGMRVGELVRLERGDLMYDVQGALIRYAKGGKEREALFDNRAWEAIQTYLRARNDAARGRDLSRLPVFARHDRRAGDRVLPIGARSIQAIMADLAERSGIAEKFHLTPHTLRHFFATEFLSLTGDLALTQHALGHAGPTTTRIYAQTKREDYIRAHRQVFGG